MPKVKSLKEILKENEKGRVIVDVNLKLGESFDINNVFTTLEKNNQAFFECDNRSDLTKFLFPMNYWIFRFSGTLFNSTEFVWIQLRQFSYLLLYCNQLAHLYDTINHKNNAASKNEDRAIESISFFKVSRDFFRYYIPYSWRTCI